MAKITSTQPDGGASNGELRVNIDVQTGFFQGAVTARRAVQYAVIDGEAIFEGDIVLGSAADMQAHADSVRDGTSLVASDAGEVLQGVVITGQVFRWPNGSIPFTIDGALPNPQRVRDAIAHWQANTSIRFVARTVAHLNWVTFRPGNGCSSQVGMRGGQQFITLAAECSTGNTIHEIGHAVGLWHEQSREDRDHFVRIQWQNIQPGVEHNFNQHITDGDDIGAYDYDSLMHYPAMAFSKNNQATIVALGGQAIGQRTGLSAGDIATVRAIYPPPKALAKDAADTKRRKDGKDNKDRKDVKERKDTKERKDAKDTKDTKERKDNKDTADTKGVKERKETKDTKDVRDIPRPPWKPPFGDPAESGVDSDLQARIAALEQSVSQFEHFIDSSLRPDMSTSALGDEPDAAATAAELDAISAELQALADEAAQQDPASRS